MFTELPFSTGSFVFNLRVYLFVFQMEFEMNTTVFNSLLLHWEHQGTSLQLLEQVCYQARQHGLVVLLKLTAATQDCCSAQEKGLEMWLQGREGDGTQSCRCCKAAFKRFSLSEVVPTTISLVFQPRQISHIHIPHVPDTSWASQ